jgi:hypothetical protein
MNITEIVVRELHIDKELERLYNQLGEIHKMAFPINIVATPTGVEKTYSSEINELIEKTHQEIDFRKKQIISFYKNNFKQND